MSVRWVCNAFPIIALARIGHSDLITALCQEVVVPGAVAQEIRKGPVEDPAARWIDGPARVWIREMGSPDPLVAAWDLGAGETEVISWARTHPDFDAILDDRAARTCAAALNVPVRGTLAVLLLGKQRGLLKAVSPALASLEQAGFRIHPILRSQIVAEAGE